MEESPTEKKKRHLEYEIFLLPFFRYPKWLEYEKFMHNFCQMKSKLKKKPRTVLILGLKGESEVCVTHPPHFSR